MKTKTVNVGKKGKIQTSEKKIKRAGEWCGSERWREKEWRGRGVGE